MDLQFLQEHPGELQIAGVVVDSKVHRILCFRWVVSNTEIYKWDAETCIFYLKNSVSDRNTGSYF